MTETPRNEPPLKETHPHRPPADPQVTQPQIAKEGDKRIVYRAEQVASHTSVAGIERPPFETQPGEIIRDHRPGMLSGRGWKFVGG